MKWSKNDSSLNGEIFVNLPIIGKMKLGNVSGDPSSDFSTPFQNAMCNGKILFYVEDGDIWGHLDAAAFGNKSEARMVLFKTTSS